MRGRRRGRRALYRFPTGNLLIDFGGANIVDVEPARLPDLYHGAPLRIYGRYADSGLTKVTIKGDVQGQPFEQSVEVELPKVDDSNPEIERMWAWKRVDQLLADARQKGETSQVVGEIVELCEDFSIVSEYASFIVLENDAEYRRWKIERRNLSRIERDRRAQAQVQFALETARDESLAKLGPRADARQLARSVPQSADNFPQPDSSMPLPDASTSPVSIPSRPGNGVDISLPTGGGGGGAIDPISAAIGLGLASAAAAAARRRKVTQDRAAE